MADRRKAGGRDRRALPVRAGECQLECPGRWLDAGPSGAAGPGCSQRNRYSVADRKSTRLKSNHLSISYAVFFLKKITPDPLPDATDPTAECARAASHPVYVT